MSDGGAPPVSIEPFRAGTEGAIVDLIVGIQNGEFGVAITAADQPDLADIEGFYRTGAGGFWTASANGEIVGTIALKAFGHDQGALRKMFVAPAWRGGKYEVGARLLATLLAHARAQGLAYVTLGTTAQFVGAHRFYEKNGFVEIAADALPPAFPRMPLDTKFYRLDLGAAASGQGAMFARLILTLLLAAFAVPALANGPCHDAPVARMTPAMHHELHSVPRQDDRAAVPHVCIGCIPPATLASRDVPAPPLRAALPRRVVAARFDPASETPPALPPPRNRA